MKNILSYDKFSINEGIINTIKKAISKKQDLDDVVEGIFDQIKAHFDYSNFIDNSDVPTENNMEWFAPGRKNWMYDQKSFAYKFNNSDVLYVVNTREIIDPVDLGVEKGIIKKGFDRDYYPNRLYINNDDITNLVNRYLIKDIYYYFAEMTEKYNKHTYNQEKNNLKDKFKNRYGDDGRHAASPMKTREEMTPEEDRDVERNNSFE